MLFSDFSSNPGFRPFKKARMENYLQQAEEISTPKESQPGKENRQE